MPISRIDPKLLQLPDESSGPNERHINVLVTNKIQYLHGFLQNNPEKVVSIVLYYLRKILGENYDDPELGAVSLLACTFIKRLDDDLKSLSNELLPENANDIEKRIISHAINYYLLMEMDDIAQDVLVNTTYPITSERLVLLAAKFDEADRDLQGKYMELVNTLQMASERIIHRKPPNMSKYLAQPVDSYKNVFEKAARDFLGPPYDKASLHEIVLELCKSKYDDINLILTKENDTLTVKIDDRPRETTHYPYKDRCSDRQRVEL